MTAMVLKALSVTLGIFFVFVGSLKLTPSLSDELYKEMVYIHLFIMLYVMYKNV